MLKAKPRFIEDFFSITQSSELAMFDERIMPHKLAPVIVVEGTQKKLKLTNFSLIPSWSKERRVKFATHNARLETIAEMPT
jgi:putative SOS response-associated peptidase YedK